MHTYAWTPLLLWGCTLFAQSIAGQPAFAVASVKPSQRLLGKDANTQLSIGNAAVSGKNLTLKKLITEAYDVQPYQVSGGPKWLDNDEYDIDAKADGATSKEQLRLMLQSLLTDRFGLAMHSETKEHAVHELIVDKGGPKIHATADSEHSVARSAGRSFHGDMRQFANLLSVQLSIPPVEDPSKPSFASGSPVPVVDKTGLAGVFDFPVEFRPEAGGDMYVFWQRILQDQLGLKLERRKSMVEFWVVDRATRIPTAN